MKSYDALFSNITYLVLLHYLRNRKPRTDSALVHAACNTVQLLQRYQLSFHLNHAPNSLYSWMHWLQDLWSYTAAWIWVVSQKDWRNQAAGWIDAMHYDRIWGKTAFPHFPFLPGSAEAQVIWDGIVKCLLIAYFVCNISAKKYQSVHLCQSCSKPKVGRFLRHSVYWYIYGTEKVQVTPLGRTLASSP